MAFGVTQTGFVIKPLDTILAEIEQRMRDTFGENVIQTAQSPLGQLNGVMASLIADTWELAESVYSGFDLDTAEGVNLDNIGKLRDLQREGETDEEFRARIANRGHAIIQLSDLIAALQGTDTVRFVNIRADFADTEVETHNIYIYVQATNYNAIGAVLNDFISPGVYTVGDHHIEYNDEGYCRQFYVTDVIEEPLKLELTIRFSPNANNVINPSDEIIADTFVREWYRTRLNGTLINHFTLRHIIERSFENMELVRFKATVNGVEYFEDETVQIADNKILSITTNDISIVRLDNGNQ